MDNNSEHLKNALKEIMNYCESMQQFATPQTARIYNIASKALQNSHSSQVDNFWLKSE